MKRRVRPWMRREAKQQLRMRDRAEARMAPQVEAELNRVRAAAAEAYPNWKDALPEHAKRMRSLLRTSFQRTASQGADAARERVRELLRGKADTSADLGQRIFRRAEQNAASKVGGITDRTRERIANVVALGASESLPPEAIARKIRDPGDGVDARRARTIARTEAHAAQSVGQSESMALLAEETGLELMKTWISTGDDRTRESHLEADGQTVPLDGVFKVGGAELDAPGDPNGPPEEVINCRCAVTYDEARAATRDAVDEPKPEPTPAPEPAPAPEPEPEPTTPQAPEPEPVQETWQDRVSPEGQYTGTLEQAKDDLRAFGLRPAFHQTVKADTPVFKNAVGATLRSVAELEARGYNITKRDITIVYAPNVNKLSTANAAFNYQDNMLKVYTNAPQWTKGKKTSVSGWSATKTIDGTITHELGHAMHTRMHVATEIPRNYKTSVKKHVSQYAAENTREFVAEVFSGWIAGKVFPDGILAYYRTLHGPPLKEKP